MSQMAPMNWLTLFIFFFIVFMMFNSLNYFSFKYSSKLIKVNMNKKEINWKW